MGSCWRRDPRQDDGPRSVRGRQSANPRIVGGLGMVTSRNAAPAFCSGRTAPRARDHRPGCTSAIAPNRWASPCQSWPRESRKATSFGSSWVRTDRTGPSRHYGSAARTRDGGHRVAPGAAPQGGVEPRSDPVHADAAGGQADADLEAALAADPGGTPGAIAVHQPLRREVVEGRAVHPDLAGRRPRQVDVDEPDGDLDAHWDDGARLVESHRHPGDARLDVDAADVQLAEVQVAGQRSGLSLDAPWHARVQADAPVAPAVPSQQAVLGWPPPWLVRRTAESVPAGTGALSVEMKPAPGEDTDSTTGLATAITIRIPPIARSDPRWTPRPTRSRPNPMATIGIASRIVCTSGVTWVARPAMVAVRPATRKTSPVQ